MNRATEVVYLSYCFLACEQASFGRKEEEGEKGKGEGKKEKRKKPVWQPVVNMFRALYREKIPINQLLSLHSSWSAKFCFSLFKMASCANETMAVEIIVVEVTTSFCFLLL